MTDFTRILWSEFSTIRIGEGDAAHIGESHALLRARIDPFARHTVAFQFDAQGTSDCAITLIFIQKIGIIAVMFPQ